MSLRASILSLTCAVAATSGCASLVVVQPNLPRPDSVTQPSLQAFMSSAARPSIVLRVPAPQRQLSQAQALQGDVEMSRAYNNIEKELVKAGFTVRDRGLLEEVLRSSQNLDYRVIEGKIDAQLILEIASITSQSYHSKSYRRVKDNKVGSLLQKEFPIVGWQFECKIVMVNSGEIGGIYTIDVAPVDNSFIVDGDNFWNANEQGKLDKNYIGYGVPFEISAPIFVQKLIGFMKQPAR